MINKKKNNVNRLNYNRTNHITENDKIEKNINGRQYVKKYY